MRIMLAICAKGCLSDGLRVPEVTFAGCSAYAQLRFRNALCTVRSNRTQHYLREQNSKMLGLNIPNTWITSIEAGRSEASHWDAIRQG
jgi:hypothetical protein